MSQQDRAAWLEERRTGIGGSDIAIIAGFGKWKTEFQLWLEKTGRLKDDVDNDAMFWGRLLEDDVIEGFTHRTGIVVARHPEIIRHPEHTFALASVDGLVGDDAGFEAKTCDARNAWQWGEEGTYEIPTNYLFQVQWYMGITGRNRWYVAVLIGGNTLKTYEIKFSPELFALLIGHARRFWFDHVLADVAPERNRLADSRLLYPYADEMKSVLATNDVLAVIDEIRAFDSEKKMIENHVDALKSKLMEYMGDASHLKNFMGQTVATWKNTKRGRQFKLKGILE